MTTAAQPLSTNSPTEPALAQTDLDLLDVFFRPRDEHFFDKHIQFVQIYVRQEWADDATLWCPAVRAVVLPILQISCFQTHPNEVQQPTIVNVSG